MKVLNFCSYSRDPWKLDREASLEEVFAYLEMVPSAVILFIDRSRLSQELSAQPWVHRVAQIVEVDQDIAECLGVDLVPEFRFYFRGREVGRVTGHVDESEFVESQPSLFQ